MTPVTQCRLGWLMRRMPLSRRAGLEMTARLDMGPGGGRWFAPSLAGWDIEYRTRTMCIGAMPRNTRAIAIIDDGIRRIVEAVDHDDRYRDHRIAAATRTR